MTRWNTLSWARTLHSLSRADESSAVLEALLDNCVRFFGPQHNELHIIRVELSRARLQQGRLHDARKLSAASMKALTEQFGAVHAETLEAMDAYGRSVSVDATIPTMVEARNFARADLEDQEKVSRTRTHQDIGITSVVSLMLILDRQPECAKSGRSKFGIYRHGPPD